MAGANIGTDKIMKSKITEAVKNIKEIISKVKNGFTNLSNNSMDQILKTSQDQAELVQKLNKLI